MMMKRYFCGTKLVERGVLSMDEELNIIKIERLLGIKK